MARPLLRPCAGQHAGHAVIAFVAGVLVELAFTLPDGDFDGPWSFPGCRIVDRELINQFVRVDAAEPLGEFHIRAADAAEWIFVGEIRRLHNQRIALPMPAGIAFP